MLKIIGGIVIALIAIVLVLAARQPDEFRVQRAIAIQAPPEKIYPLIANLKRWRAWSPYEEKDSAMRREYSGPESGVGAHYAWDGDKNVGKGSMTIASATEPNSLVIDLRFKEPMQAHNTAQFDLTPTGAATQVTWSMHGPNTFIGKVMGLIFDVDKMVGDDFAAGLAKLKTVAEQ